MRQRLPGKRPDKPAERSQSRKPSAAAERQDRSGRHRSADSFRADAGCAIHRACRWAKPGMLLALELRLRGMQTSRATCGRRSIGSI